VPQRDPGISAVDSSSKAIGVGVDTGCRARAQVMNAGTEETGVLGGSALSLSEEEEEESERMLEACDARPASNSAVSDDDSGCAIEEFTWIPAGLTPMQVTRLYELSTTNK